jgi:hypothetical protein
MFRQNFTTYDIMYMTIKFWTFLSLLFPPPNMKILLHVSGSGAVEHQQKRIVLFCCMNKKNVFATKKYLQIVNFGMKKGKNCAYFTLVLYYRKKRTENGVILKWVI